jgi:ribosomal protein S6--L-glutamate ligase
VSLSQEEEQQAIRAADAVGALAAGVDLLPGPEGEWHVLEVNAVPGWRALAPVAEVDVAAEVVRYLAKEYRKDLTAGGFPSPPTPLSAGERGDV